MWAEAVAQGVNINSIFFIWVSTIYKFGSDHGLFVYESADGKKRKVCLHLDEFNELVGKEFVPMANKAGGAGFQLTGRVDCLDSRSGGKKFFTVQRF